MQRVHHARGDGAPRRDERLPRDLPAEDANPVLLRRPAAKEVQLQFLEIEDRHEEVERLLVARVRHASAVAQPRGRVKFRAQLGLW